MFDYFCFIFLTTSMSAERYTATNPPQKISARRPPISNRYDPFKNIAAHNTAAPNKNPIP